MRKGYRSGRLGEEIKKLISDMLLKEIKDPRLKKGLLSISAVDVTSDGSYATVYLSTLSIKPKSKEDTRKEKEAVLAAFKGAEGLIRRQIGKKIKLKHVPELAFKIDESLEYGMHMDDVFSKLNAGSCDESEEDEK